MKKKLFIYQNGFIEDEDCLKPLIDLVIKKDTSKSVLFSDVFYLNGFKKNENKFIDEISFNYFNESIQKLNKLIIESNCNAIHIVTSLIGPKGLDDFMLGTQKLIYLIEYIKNFNDVDIILVGHSQGGLLNLVVGCNIPLLIKDMVSIVTPYKESFFGNLVNLGINFSKVLLYKNPIRLLGEKYGRYVGDDIKKSIKGIKLLSNKKIYDKYRALWANLSNKPHLYVVSSLAGLIKYNKKLVYFDGILTLKEQNEIDAYKRIIILEPSIKDLDIDLEMKETKKISNSNNNIPVYDATTFKNRLFKCALKHPYLRYDEEYFEFLKVLKEAILVLPRTTNTYNDFDKIWRNDYNHYTIRVNPQIVDLIISLM